MEYSGYIPTSNLDIAGLTSRLGKSIYGIEVSKQEKRAELDKIKADAEEVINSQEMTDSQDFNEFIIRGADNGRNALMNLNKQLKAGELRPSEYRAAVSKIQKNWGVLANSAKSFDEQFKSYAKRQEPGANGFPEASQFEMALAENYGKVAELQNKDLKFNSKGDLYTIDNATGETWSMDVINRPENIYQNRYDMPGSVADITKGFEAWEGWKDLGRGGEKSIEGFLQNPASKVAIQTGVNAMVSSPRNAISILTDWGNIQASYYKNEDEYKQMYSDAASKLMQAKQQAGLPTELTKEEKDNIEMSLVKIEKQGAVINPVLSEKQMNKAKEISENFIRSNVYEKVTGKAKQDWYHAPVSDDKNGLSQKDILSGIELYKLTKNAFEQSKPGDNSRNNDYLRSAGEKTNKFLVKTKKVENGKTTYPIIAYEYEKDEVTGKPTKKVDWTTGSAYFQGKSLASEITGKTPDEANTLWEIGNEYKDQIESTPLKKEGQTIETYSRQDLLSNGWSESQIKEAVKLGKIKVK